METLKKLVKALRRKNRSKKTVNRLIAELNADAHRFSKISKLPEEAQKIILDNIVID